MRCLDAPPRASFRILLLPSVPTFHGPESVRLPSDALQASLSVCERVCEEAPDSLSVPLAHPEALHRVIFILSWLNYTLVARPSVDASLPPIPPLLAATTLENSIRSVFLATATVLECATSPPPPGCLLSPPLLPLWASRCAEMVASDAYGPYCSSAAQLSAISSLLRTWLAGALQTITDLCVHTYRANLLYFLRTAVIFIIWTFICGCWTELFAFCLACLFWLCVRAAWAGKCYHPSRCQGRTPPLVYQGVC